MRKLLALTLTALLAATAAATGGTAAGTTNEATVTTDQTDYQPGETVIIHGTGWAAGETVRLSIHQESSDNADTVLTSEADEYGVILNKEFSVTEEHRGASFTLTATGAASARTATAKFTDGGTMTYSPNGTSLTAFSGPAGSSAASFAQTVTAPSGNGNFQAPATVTPTSVSGSTPMPAAWVSVTGGAGNFNTGPANNPKNPPDFKIRNVSVTPAANTPAGVYTAIITATPSIGGVATGQGTLVTLTVTADNAPPSTTAGAIDSNNNPYGGVNFTNANKVTVTLTANDTGSGVQSTLYKIDNGNFQNYSGPFDISSEGVRVVTYFSIDNTGTQETAHFFTVKIDKTAPAVNCGAADGQWHAADVSIPCTSTDQGGQQKSGLADASDAAFSLTTNVPADTEDANASTDSRQVCDNAGNCATAGPVAGNKVDKKAPSYNCGAADTNWHANDVSIPCTSADGGSGLADAADASFSLTTNVPNGTETSNASTDSRQVCDATGNCSTAGPVAGNMIDKKAPDISCASDDGSWHGSNVSLACTSTDGGSGLADAADAAFSLSTGIPAGTETSNASTGSRNVADAVGNSATAGPVSGIKVDRKAPTYVCDSPDGLWHASDVTLQCVASDGGSGVNGSTNAALSTSVPAGTEDSNASTGSHAFTDNVGNSATAGPINGNKVDKKAPSVNCGAADGQWHAADVSIPCTSADGGSGLGNAADASFSLTTSVAAGTETSNASTNSRAVADAVGNSATAGPVAGNKVDKKAPVINITTPANGASYLLNQAVASAYTVTDGGSGVASSTPANGGALNTSTVGSKTFSVTATDNVGNQSSASAGYTVGYGVVALYDQTKSVKRGATIPIKIRLVDAGGANVSSPATVVSAVRLVLVGGGASDAIISDQNNANGDGNFRYDASLGGYIFNLSTKNMGLIDGTWRLDFAPAGDPATHSVYFGVVR